MRWAARGMGVVALLALGACRSPEAGPPALEVPAAGLRCALLLPPELREAMMPGAQLVESRPCPTCGPVCSLRAADDAGEPVASVAYDCRTRLETDPLRLLAPLLRAGGEEVPALGRAAARTSPAPGMLQVVSFDDDTPCGLVVTWLGAGSERALDLSRAALQAATPDSVTGVAPPPPLVLPTLSEEDGGSDGGTDGGSDADAGADAGMPDAGPAPGLRPRRPRPVAAPDGGPALPVPGGQPTPEPTPAPGGQPSPAMPPAPAAPAGEAARPAEPQGAAPPAGVAPASAAPVSPPDAGTLP